MKYKGVIFDLDGTLANTLNDIADSMNTVLSNCGFPTHKLEAYKYFVGKGIKNLVVEALPITCRKEEQIKSCFESMLNYYENDCLKKTRLYDGIVELLDALTKRKMKLAVFSNKADRLTKKIIQNLLGNYNFDIIIGARSDVPRKPDPTGALLISNELGISPQNLVYVGDTGIDMRTANSAKMFAVGVLWGFRSEDELIANGAQALLKKPLDLIETLINKK